MTKVRDEAKVAGRSHDSRHTLVTELAESGAGDEVIMSIAGHISPAMLSRDAHVRMTATDTNLIGARDRALILLGFSGAFRRSELVGPVVEDCSFNGDGLTVTRRRSKIDQAAAGRKIGIPYGSNPERARYARFRHGSNRRPSPPGRCFAPSIATGRCNRAGCLVSTWHGL